MFNKLNKGVENVNSPFKSKIKSEVKKRVFAKEVMQMMQEREFDIEDAETFPSVLAEEIKKNNERFEKEKPFVIYEA